MPEYLGASAEFIPRPGVAFAAPGILDIGQWPADQAIDIGYVMGGIQSSESNIFFANEGDLSVASNRIFRVWAEKMTTATELVPGVTAEGYFQLRIHPNPASDRLHMYFRTHKREWVQLALFDLQGKRVGPSFEGVLDADRHEFEWALDSLPSGTYFVGLKNGEEFEVEQMVVK
jgi:hypothetical protein